MQKQFFCALVLLPLKGLINPELQKTKIVKQWNVPVHIVLMTLNCLPKKFLLKEENENWIKNLLIFKAVK